ncbi:solute carrier family 36 (proton-coupled amino acid transporter) [Tremella mesenterica]|uniref:Solute carrier family 36 (Proton-coupled amino acid transporter) n=1 Tax=Tremella mesenterica TaxID=5217 RepID=A0A4V1M3Z1_TREME|nr:solute carrier family 36 (proton-coupled amino acid transporter) [Tremella mesenterica]
MTSPLPVDRLNRSIPVDASSNSQPKPRSLASARPIAGTPISIRNIPPRLSSSVSRSLSRSFTPSGRQPPIPKVDNKDLEIGHKSLPIPLPQTSALTAALAVSPQPALSPALSRESSMEGLSAKSKGKRKESGTSIRPPVDLPRKASSGNVRSPPLKSNGSGSSTPKTDVAFSQAAEVSTEAKAEVLRRHLVSAEERRKSSSTPTPAGQTPRPASPEPRSGDGYGAMGETSGQKPVVEGESGVSRASGMISNLGQDDPFPMPYDAPGGDVTHDLYKWQHDHDQQARLTRSASFSHIPLDRSAILDPTLAHIKEPGGFRRNFVVNRAHEQGLEAPTMLRNVVEFLYFYGHFAGEDLEEDSDEESDDLDGQLPTLASIENGRNPIGDSATIRGGIIGWEPRAPSTERTSLLGTRGNSKTRHRRMRSGPQAGTASTAQAVLMLLKGFVGILFSSIILLGMAAICLWSFMLLIKCYMVVPASFGDIGGVLYGNYMRLIILASITISQLGFVAAYTIFIAENLQAFVLAVTNCKTYISVGYLIFAQLLVFLPLSMIRNLAKLSGTALVADAFILIGLIYIGTIETTVLAKRGVADVALFNKADFPLLIGTAVFAFEGIGLIIPITESMRQPQKLPRLLSIVMLFVAILFAAFGVLGYGAYGKDIQTVVIVNLPQEDKFVQAVQFLYSIAILLSIPLQLFPAVRIMENGLFSRSGKHNPKVKWQKNLFRVGTVIFCSLVSWAGSAELDKFVALIGSFACVPLCFIYPPLLHLRACAKTRTSRMADYVFLCFGIGIGIYTTVQTLRSLVGSSGESPKFGKCEIPL